MDQSKVNYFALLILGVACSGITACADSEPTATEKTIGIVGLATAQTGSGTGGGMPTNVNEQLASAKQDLARRLNVDEDKIEVESVRHVHWRNGAAGCPDPKMSYTMAHRFANNSKSTLLSIRFNA